MNHADFQAYHAELCERGRRITVAKNHDYSDPERFAGDPMAIFQNFLRCEQFGICTVEQGFLTRLTDKFARLANLCQPKAEAAVKDESVEDTAVDMINYIILLMAYRKTKRELSTIIPATAAEITSMADTITKEAQSVITQS